MGCGSGYTKTLSINLSHEVNFRLDGSANQNLQIMCIFDRCHHNWPAATPAKHECAFPTSQPMFWSFWKKPWDNDGPEKFVNTNPDPGKHELVTRTDRGHFPGAAILTCSLGNRIVCFLQYPVVWDLCRRDWIMVWTCTACFKTIT